MTDKRVVKICEVTWLLDIFIIAIVDKLDDKVEWRRVEAC